MKILVPVDGSSQANAALDFVASRTKLLGHQPSIQLINVQPALSARVIRAVGREEARAYQRAQADDVLRPAATRLRHEGIPAVASYALGNRVDAIGAVATKGRVDLIVMGSRGHSGLKGVLFGSMANAVLAGCSTPVLMLRSAKAPVKDTLSVGIAVDGSRLGEAALRWVIRHRALFGVQPHIELIHVHDGESDAPAPMDGVAWRAVPAYMRVASDDVLVPAFDKITAGPRKLLAKAGIDATVVHLRGPSAGDAIAAYARRRRLDVLAMGSHGRGAFKSLVLGSVAMRVAARCELPLLIIRAAERRPAAAKTRGPRTGAAAGRPGASRSGAPRQRGTAPVA
jgi:nucleotide-binding universal stress UspA family protein